MVYVYLPCLRHLVLTAVMDRIGDWDEHCGQYSLALAVLLSGASSLASSAVSQGAGMHKWEISLCYDHGLTFYLWWAPALNCTGVRPTAPCCIPHTAFRGLIIISSWNHFNHWREGDDICLTSAQWQAAHELETCNTDENIQLKVRGVITVAGHYRRASVPLGHWAVYQHGFLWYIF